MAGCSNPSVLLEVETSGHSEELLSLCKYAAIAVRLVNVASGTSVPFEFTTSCFAETRAS